MVKNKLSILLLLLVLSLPALGSVNRYVVFFKDKNGSAYSIDRPGEFLSGRALQRRSNQNIDITDNDLPVSDGYLSALELLHEVNVYFPTKWMNGVLVEMDESMVDDVSSLSFVRDVTYVARGSKLNGLNINGGRKSHKQKEAGAHASDKESQAQNAFIDVDAMHNAGYRGDGILLAIFDSGYEFVEGSPYFSHIFSDNKVKGTKDFVKGSSNVFQYDSHGSKVLSCISAFNAGEYSGTAPEVDLALCVTEDITSEYMIEEYNWLFAAEYADSLGVDIINSSVGYSYFDDDRMDYTYEDMDGKTAIISRAATLAASKGMLVVSSAGNEGNTTWKYLNAPADADSVLSVGASTYDMERSSFSSFGPTSDGRIKPDIAALGSSVKVVHKNGVTLANGTSFSAPMVAGLAAGFWQAFPGLTNMDVIQYLKITASQANTPDTLLGFGIPNFMKAYNKAKSNETNVDHKFVVFPNPVTNKRVIYFYTDTLTDKTATNLNFYDLKGSFIGTKKMKVKNAVEPVEVDVSFLRPGSYILTYDDGVEMKKSKLVVL